jgi:hypothetical protein
MVTCVSTILKIENSIRKGGAQPGSDVRVYIASSTCKVLGNFPLASSQTQMQQCNFALNTNLQPEGTLVDKSK